MNETAATMMSLKLWCSRSPWATVPYRRGNIRLLTTTHDELRGEQSFRRDERPRHTKEAGSRDENRPP